MSFDAIARDRVLTSLAQTTLDSMANLKAAYLDLAIRLGTVPRLFDFARFDAVDPVVLATKEKNYWRLLTKFAGPQEAPAPHLDRMLNLLTQEVLNGKRPQELVLLDTLLREPTLTLAEAVLALAERGLWESPWSVSRILRVLTVEHFPAKDPEALCLPVVQVEGERVSLTPGFLAAMQDPTFAGHVRDVVETGLFLSRQRYGLAPSLQVAAVLTQGCAAPAELGAQRVLDRLRLQGRSRHGDLPHLRHLSQARARRGHRRLRRRVPG